MGTGSEDEAGSSVNSGTDDVSVAELSSSGTGVVSDGSVEAVLPAGAAVEVSGSVGTTAGDGALCVSGEKRVSPVEPGDNVFPEMSAASAANQAAVYDAADTPADVEARDP